MKLLVLGASGMLGYTLFHGLQRETGNQLYGTLRSESKKIQYFREEQHSRITSGIDISDIGLLDPLFDQIRPEVVINCIGIIKQLPEAHSSISAIYTNALFPHLLYEKCVAHGARLIHFSSDCVFSGSDGNYTEQSLPDAQDLYGRTKLLGEVRSIGALTIRTSIIGHELDSNVSLVDWFLSQNKPIKGYSRAVFSGFPSEEIVNILNRHILPRPELSGLIHISANPITKLDLLLLIKARYAKEIEIKEDDHVKIDRSLNSNHFRNLCGYKPPAWPELIETMYNGYRRMNETLGRQVV